MAYGDADILERGGFFNWVCEASKLDSSYLREVLRIRETKAIDSDVDANRDTDESY